MREVIEVCVIEVCVFECLCVCVCVCVERKAWISVGGVGRVG